MDRTDATVPVGFAYFTGAVGFGLGAVAATGWMSWWIAAPWAVLVVLGMLAAPRA